MGDLRPEVRGHFQISQGHDAWPEELFRLPWRRWVKPNGRMGLPVGRMGLPKGRTRLPKGRMLGAGGRGLVLGSGFLAREKLKLGKLKAEIVGQLAVVSGQRSRLRRAVGLAHGAEGFARRAGCPAHGAKGLAHRAEGFAHRAEGLAHGAEGLARGAKVLACRAEGCAHGADALAGWAGRRKIRKLED